MFDWDDLRCFLAVARTGKLSRAGTRLGINATTVGRRLTLLEEQLHAKLFDRTPDGFTLTAAGRELLPRAERMQAEADAVARDVVGADVEHAGVVRISVTEMIGTRFIAPRLLEFRRRYPRIAVDLNCTMRDVSLSRREADIALRLARPQELGVVTRRLADIPLAVYASRAYLAQRKLTVGPALDGHDVILFAATRRFARENEWIEDRMEGAHLAMRSDSVSAIFSAIVSGVGVGLLPRTVADPEPELVRLPIEGAPEPRTIWLAVHEDVQRSARVQAVLDLLRNIDEPFEPKKPAS